MKAVKQSGWMLAALALVSLAAPTTARATKEIGTTADTLTLLSPAFEHQGEIPVKYTCEGEDASPPLAWSGEPAKTQSFVLVMEDPEASEQPRRAFTQWLVLDVPPASHALRESVKARRDLPEGAREGTNDAQRVGYSGPCPAAGRKHHYLFKLYALDTVLDLEAPTKAELEPAMHGHVLARAELLGTYERKK